jgi:chaperonin GroEL
MSLFQVNKPKSAAKIMVPSSDQLTRLTVGTLDDMASMAGQTLGPGGKLVAIERPEVNMKPIITKDGVTVIKSLGFDNPVKQLILEAARDAAIRTANEAGDGTTTATVLSSAICRATMGVVKDNPKLSSQVIVREMQRIMPELMNKISSYKLEIDADNYDATLLKVATLSANGDIELSKKIVEGLDLVGEDGDMTIVEINAGGQSRYALEKINGYTIGRGYEESARTLAQGFINDKSGTMIVLDKPVVLMYDGVINDFMQVFDALQKLHQEMNTQNITAQNVVLVAHGFSDGVLGDLHMTWNHAKAIMKICPLLTPDNAILNWRSSFLHDLQAYVGTPVFNPIDKPMIDMDPAALLKQNRTKKFECSRFKTMIFADEDEAAVQIRVDELKLQRENPESDFELNDLNVRIGKLTSGIVRLNIYGPSAGETRERRDRAEDAWMAIKGAIKSGAVPGGGYVLVRLAAFLEVTAAAMKPGARRHAIEILAQSFLEPVRLLYQNYGYNQEDADEQIIQMLMREDETYDILEESWIPKYDLLDSLPAVAEAIRNSVSISSLLGTLGGVVAFQRDSQTDKDEETFVRNFEAAIGERGSVNGNRE